MNDDNSRVKRIEDFLLDPEKAIFTTLEEFRAAVDQILPVLQKIDFTTLETLKGEDGKTPERGVDYMTQDDINALEAFILSKMPRADVDYASIEATEAFIKSQIALIPRIKGDKGEPGAPGKAGKNGSPDSGADILRKLRDLGRNQGLQISDIRGLENRVKFFNTLADEFYALRDEFNNQKIVLPASTGGSGGSVASIVAGTGIAVDSTDPLAPIVSLNGASIASLALADSAVQPGDDISTLVNNAGYLTNITGKISQGTNITITGTGTSGDPYVINASGGASGDVVGPASSTNNHVAFFDGATGKLLKDSGLTLSGTNTGDQTSIVGISGTKAQFDTALSDGNFLYVGDITQYTDEMAQDAVGAMVSTAFTYTDSTPLLALTSRTIGGVAYDGTANITVATATGGFTVSGGNLAIGANDLTLTGSIGATGARATKVWTAALESTAMPTVGGVSLSSTFAGIAGSTSQAFAVSTLDVGNADTTISRGAAGFIAVEGNRVPSPASQATGDILYRGATEWERLPVGSNGKVLTLSSGLPSWQTAPGAPSSLTMIPKPEVSTSGAFTSVQLNSNTTAIVGIVNIPHKITTNALAIRKTSLGTSGNFKVALFTTDGQTKIFEETVATAAGTGLILWPMATPVAIDGGTYYIMVVPVSTTDFTTSCYTTQSAGTLGADSLYSDGGSLAPYEGTLTVSAGTIPSTFTPSSISPVANRTLAFRMENISTWIITFTANGTWVAPAGVTSVKVETWGAGGGGGRVITGAASGGGGGAYSINPTYSVTPAASYTVVVGAGGPGASNGSGTDGGDSYFDSSTSVMAKGGKGGGTVGSGTVTGALGGAAASGFGTTKYSGGNGGNASSNGSSSGGSSAGTASNGTNDGAAPPTGGGQGGAGANGSQSGSGSAPGGGGGGNQNGNSPAGQGADGKVKITYTI